jgi:NTE family protein
MQELQRPAIVRGDAPAPVDVTGGVSAGAQPVRAPRRASRRQPRWRGYTAFVLSGGGARGALQVGALRALLEGGERPDVVIGTSIGAWNGAWLAREPTVENMDELARNWQALTSHGVLLGTEAASRPRQAALPGLRLLMAARRLTAGMPSLYSDVGLRQLVERHFGDATFETLALPLRIIATDLSHGTRAIFSRGLLRPAIMASSALPGVFPPVAIDGHTYVDGGAIDNCSLETALALGARRIIVIDVDYDDCQAPSPLWSGDLSPAALRARGASMHAMAAVLERMAQVVCQYQLNRALERVPRGVEVHVLRPGRGVEGGVLDFERAQAWIEHAYTVTRAYLRAHRPQPVVTAS